MAKRSNSWRRTVAVIGAAGALTAIYLLGSRYVSLDGLAGREAALRTHLRERPLQSVMICFFTYVCVSFVPGTTGKSLIVAWLFGFWTALLIVNVALTIAAIGSMLAARHLLQDTVSSRFEVLINRANRAFARDGGLYVLLLRLLHAPFTLVNYSLGATSIRTRTFWWATQVGLLPGNVIFVYAGAKLPSIQHIADRGIESVLTLELLVALVGLTVVPITIKWLVAKCWPRVKTDVEVATDLY